MDQQSKEKQLKCDYSNYERTVWVVNSIEGHLQRYYSALMVYFDRYPRIKVDGKELTPDFTVVFSGPYEIVGEVKRALGRNEIIDKRFEQIKEYDQPMQLRTAEGNVYQHFTANHDILLLINAEYANPESKKLSELVKAERKNGKLVRAVSVFSTAYDNQAAKARWILTWQNYSDKLRDTKLPAGQRLSERHQEAEEPILIYPDDFTGVQAIHRFCNDDPPPIYVTVILWSRIFPRMMTTEQRDSWTLDSDCQGVVDIKVTVEQLVDTTRKFVNYQVKASLLRDVLKVLCKAKLAEQKSEGEYIVHFRRLRLANVEDGEEGEELKLDHVKEALIRAIVRGEFLKRSSGVRIGRSGRRTSDKNQLNLL